MTTDTEVLIVGAGPTGLTLAVDLAMKGVRCTIIERKEAPQFLPKMERCNARSMEIFRRLGLADKIRAAGLDNDVPMDVFIILAMNEPPLLHLPYPSVNQAKAEIARVNDGSMPAEPYQLVSQYTVEPLLKSVADSLPTCTVRFGYEFLELRQDAAGVDATVRSNGATETIRAQYLVACDGGGSPVRKQLGIELRGEANLLELRQALYRCDSLFGMLPIGNGPGHGRHYHVADNQATFLIMQDSTKHWTLHAVVEHDEDMATQFEKTVAVPVDYEMLYVGKWRQNLMLADRYRDGRVFLAGDAVHLVIPTGGLGMNTGVGDAIDLSWKLAATLQGWGGPGLLPSYETERRKIGERNVAASTYASRGRRAWRSKWQANIRDATPEGQATRDHLTAIADVEQRKTNEMIGAELGYRYDGSPIICDEPGGPEPDFRTYIPTTWPGARLPHVRLGDGSAMQDRIGAGYTLLRLGGNSDSMAGLAQAMAEHRAPYAELAIADDVARAVYGHDFLLLRPDLHIAWRGNRPPDDPRAVAARVTGH